MDKKLIYRKSVSEIGKTDIIKVPSSVHSIIIEKKLNDNGYDKLFRTGRDVFYCLR